jgi:hypothetical protein
MDILDLVEEDLLENYGPDVAPKLVASTNGDEYSSPCPHPECGGEDRFRIWPNHPKGPRFWCRGCGRGGNVIEYLKQFRGMSVPQAFRFLQSKGMESPKRVDRQRNSKESKDEYEYPPIEWRGQANLFISKAENCLWSSAGGEARNWLHNRGIRDEAIKKARLGWNPKDVYDSRASWGLEEEILDNGNPKKILIPRGLVIPGYNSWGAAVRLRVRNPEPDAEHRYRLVAGSKTFPMILNSSKNRGRYYVVVESELDGILLHQEAGDIVNVIALGSASTRLAGFPEAWLGLASRILVSLDNDEAGEKAFFDYWSVNFPNCVMWPVLKGKDPGEAYKNGLDIRSWVYAGLEDDMREADALIETVLEMLREDGFDVGQLPEQGAGALGKRCEANAEAM